MKRPLIALAASALLGAGIWSVPSASAETYDSEGGINWFGDYDNEALGAFDSYGTDPEEFESGDEFGFDTEIGDDETFASDDYGAYDSHYDWNTSDAWYDDWYGDSDGLF